VFGAHCYKNTLWGQCSWRGGGWWWKSLLVSARWSNCQYCENNSFPAGLLQWERVHTNSLRNLGNL
jgi:hypothetical protein